MASFCRHTWGSRGTEPPISELQGGFLANLVGFAVDNVHSFWVSTILFILDNCRGGATENI